MKKVKTLSDILLLPFLLKRFRVCATVLMLFPAMYQSSGNHAQIFLQTSSTEKSNPIGEALYGAGSDVLKTELSAYGEKLLGSGSAYVHSNVSQ